jgi:hypothetical protein
MGVPETSMYEYHFAPRGKYKVRLAWKVCPMQTKSIAESMYEAANLHLGLRVFAPDCAHVLAAIHTSSLLEFFKKPIQDGKLLFLSCPSNLRQEPYCGRLNGRDVLCALIAGRAKSAEV